MNYYRYKKSQEFWERKNGREKMGTSNIIRHPLDRIH